MDDKDILRKAMEKACDNSSRIMKNIMPHGNDFDILLDFYKNIIFDHDFAKAFWGTEEIFDQLDNRQDNLYFEGFSIFQYHLQQMVLEKEPLKYLEKFL